MKHIIALSGSLREGSYNTALLRAAQQLAPEDVTIEIVPIRDIPLFDQDREATFPIEAKSLKEAIEKADGIIISTPEYNRSIPSALKNALDWASRPYGQNSFAGKHVLVIGATVAPTGTMGAQLHLRQVLGYLDARTVGQPEFYLSSAHEKFSADGTLEDQDTRQHLQKAIRVLVDRIDS